jgi:hypothetical protein
MQRAPHRAFDPAVLQVGCRGAGAAAGAGVGGVGGAGVRHEDAAGRGFAAPVCGAVCHHPRCRPSSPLLSPPPKKEPSLYRIYEALCHGGDSIKALINEHWGDGIMSAIGGLGVDLGWGHGLGSCHGVLSGRATACAAGGSPPLAQMAPTAWGTDPPYPPYPPTRRPFGPAQASTRPSTRPSARRASRASSSPSTVRARRRGSPMTARRRARCRPGPSPRRCSRQPFPCLERPFCPNPPPPKPPFHLHPTPRQVPAVRGAAGGGQHRAAGLTE